MKKTPPGKLHLITIIWIPISALTYLLSSSIWPTLIPFVLGLIWVIQLIRKS